MVMRDGGDGEFRETDDTIDEDSGVVEKFDFGGTLNVLVSTCLGPASSENRYMY